MQRHHSIYGIDIPCIVLSTASPFKFSQDVVRSLDGRYISDGFEAIKVLSAYTGIIAPASLSEIETMPVRFNASIHPSEGPLFIRSLLEELAYA